MANHKSAIKRNKQNAKRRMRNKSVRSRLRTQINTFNAAIEAGEIETTEKAFRVAESELHRAVSKGVVPRSRASRKTSRLAVALNKARAAAAAE